MNLHKRHILETFFVVLTAGCKFIFMDWLKWRLQFVIVVVLSWLIYVVYRWFQNRDAPFLWGFRTDNFWQTFRTLIPIGVLLGLICLAVGWFNNTIIYSWHILPILIIYPIWGVIQHFLLISLTTGNLKKITEGRVSNTLIIFASATLFAAVHLPWWWLVLGTFVLALIYGYVFLKYPNLYALGLFHGWLGAICFYTVVGRDPFVEAFHSFP